jgi:hypothetical protein
MVNPLLPAPEPPGFWVTDDVCDGDVGGCGASYSSFNAHVTWDDGVSLLRSRDTDFKDSRGPVLWAMRTLKLQAWFAEHRYCGVMGQRDLFAHVQGEYTPYDTELDSTIPPGVMDPPDEAWWDGDAARPHAAGDDDPF